MLGSEHRIVPEEGPDWGVEGGMQVLGSGGLLGKALPSWRTGEGAPGVLSPHVPPLAWLPWALGEVWPGRKGCCVQPCSSLGRVWGPPERAERMGSWSPWSPSPCGLSPGAWGAAERQPWVGPGGKGPVFYPAPPRPVQSARPVTAAATPGVGRGGRSLPQGDGGIPVPSAAMEHGLLRVRVSASGVGIEPGAQDGGMEPSRLRRVSTSLA